MLKNLLAVFLLTSIGSVTFAKSISLTCKSRTDASAQGFEATIANQSATLSFEGQKVADLVFAGVSGGQGGDQESVTNYDQRVVNGYRVSVVSGGIAGLTKAIVYHGGVAGYTQEAELNDCK